MEKINITLSVIGLSLCAFLGLLAQEEQAPPSVLLKLPEVISWKIELTPTPSQPGSQNSASAQATKPQIKEILVARNKEYRRDIIRWSDGKSFERWIFPYQETRVMMLEEARELPAGEMRLREILPDQINPSKIDFPELNWLTPSQLNPGQRFEGKKADLYMLNETYAPGDTLTRKAWIDPELQRPLAFDDSFQFHKYSFSNQVPELTLPPRFVERLKLHEKNGRPKTANAPSLFLRTLAITPLISI
ncbi:MAG: hypothetical protein HC904_06590, partial [Blastochloris sp.]|nr:hypothetical protein [Blastochloris sp.]